MTNGKDSASKLRQSVRNWLCLTTDGQRFIDAAQAVMSALNSGLSREEVAQAITAELRTPPGYTDPQTVAAEITMKLHQLQHNIGRQIEAVEVSVVQEDPTRKVWNVGIRCPSASIPKSEESEE